VALSYGGCDGGSGPGDGATLFHSIPRPWLQPQDVMDAAKPHWFAGMGAIPGIIQTLLAGHHMVSTKQLQNCFEWMHAGRRDVAWYLRNWMAHKSHQGSTAASAERKNSERNEETRNECWMN